MMKMIAARSGKNIVSCCRTNSGFGVVTATDSIQIEQQQQQQHQQQYNQYQQYRYRSNRSRRGLYDGKDIGTGNNVSFSCRATKRKFKPNVFKKSIYSETLNEMIRFHITASALRSIDKAGGLDYYLLDRQNTIVEGEGYRVLQRILEKRKLNDEQQQQQQE